eukprot:35029-Eustigmatos_ZCMA.PRE.1
MASGCPTAQAWWLSLVQGLRAERRGDDETWDDESLEEQLKDSVVEIARLKQEVRLPLRRLHPEALRT